MASARVIISFPMGKCFSSPYSAVVSSVNKKFISKYSCFIAICSPFQRHLRPEVEEFTNLWRARVSHGEKPIFTCLNLLMTTGVSTERMFIAKSYRDSFSCQLWLPVRRESCLGIVSPAFSELKTILTYASTFCT